MVKGGDKPVKISFDLKGSKALVLLASDAGDGKSCDQAVWVNAKLIDKKGKETWLDEINPRQKDVGSGKYIAKAKDKKNPAVVGGKEYERYILAHAPSKLAYKLKGKYVKFEAMVGVDQRIAKNKGKGSVVFSVSNDAGKEAEGTDMAVLKQLMADFPHKSVEIMVVKDWHRQDGLNMFSIHNDYEPPTKAALESAKKTLAYVKKSGPVDDKLVAQLKALENSIARGGNWKSLWLQTHVLRRRIITSHPALDFDQILVNVNPPTKYSHNGDQHLGRHSRIGNGLGLLSNWKSGNIKINHFLKGKLPEGAVRNPDLHYDANRVVFAFCDHSRTDETIEKRYFLYEAALDGSWVKQLTGTKRDPFATCDNRATAIIEDNDPCYLPDDDIIFISTRGQSYGRCHGSRYNPAWVLHRCKPNGDGIKQLSFNNENEYEPSVLNDGRIVFTRWEYTNRHEMLFHMLWWCRPDGTAPSHYYGNDTIHPMEVVEARAIPGTHKIVATAQGHHSYNTGTSIIIDVNKGENGEEPLTHMTPETPYSETEGWPDPHYSHPYPINDELLLVSRANHRVHKQGMVPPPNDRGIYLVDPVGGRELIYEHPDYATVSPIPVRKRKRPPVIPSSLPPKAKPEATVFLQNSYLTRNDPEGIIKPGMIKALRINALGVQPRHKKRTVSMTVKNEIPKRVIGTVPVNSDGSAVFTVPANTSLQVQALDKNGMAILTEKSFFYLQPGETRSCIGCHEPEGSSPNMRAVAGLSRMKPVQPKPPAGPQYPGGMSFIRTVQPVLDRYCIGCHGLGQSPDKKESANKINLIHDGKEWPRSYKELVERGDHMVGLKAYMGGQNEERNISLAHARQEPRQVQHGQRQLHAHHRVLRPQRPMLWRPLPRQARRPQDRQAGSEGRGGLHQATFQQHLRRTTRTRAHQHRPDR